MWILKTDFIYSIPHCYFLQEAISQVMPHTTATAFDCEFQYFILCMSLLVCCFVFNCILFFGNWKSNLYCYVMCTILWWYMYIWFVEVLCIWLIIYHINLPADEDEEGDRITVRGDEELQAMINGVGFKITSISIIIIISKSLLGMLAHVCCTKLKTCVSTWYHYIIVLLELKHWIQTIDNNYVTGQH